MKKRLILLVAIMTVLVCALFALPVNAEVDADARYVRGGDWIDPKTGKTAVIDSLEKLKECFRDIEKEDKYYARVVDNRLVLDYSVVICNPITISKGSYTIGGSGCTIYRGFEGDAVITLEGNGSSLGCGAALKNNETWDEDFPKLTLDGNSEEFKNNEFGMIRVRGQAVLGIAGQVVIKNSVALQGAAIFAEAGMVNSYDNTVYSPTISITDSIVKECTSTQGGTVTVFGIDEYGDLMCERVTFKNNKSANSALSGYGGAIRCEGGEISLKECSFEYNNANRGGALYVCSKGEIVGCRFAYNQATDEGGAICGRESENGICDINLNEITIEYNTSAGVGGAISNYGKISVEGFSYLNSNTAKGNGGAVYCECEFIVNEINIVSNKSEMVGGAIYCTEKAKLSISEGEIRVNEAKYVGAIYCAGDFEFTGGAIGNNKGPAPQVILKKDTVIAKGASVAEGNIVGLCVTEENGETVYSPYIVLSEKFNSSTPISVALYRENVDENGNVAGYSNITASKSRIFDGKAELMKSAAAKFKIESSGLISYVLSTDGTVEVRFLFMPIWLCVLIVVAIVLTVVAVIAILNRDKIKKIFEKPKKQIVHHKKR